MRQLPAWSRLLTPLPASAAMVVVTCVIHYSRFLTIIIPTSRSLGFAIIAASLPFAFIARYSRRQVMIFVLVFGLMTYIYMAAIRFGLVTGLHGTGDAIGNFTGIMLLFPILYLDKSLGRRRVAQLFFWIGLVYCCAYGLISALVIETGRAGNGTIGNLILYDGIRGRRVFANSCFIAYTILYGLVRIFDQRRPTPAALGAVAIGSAALLLAQSRMSIMSLVITIALYIVGLSRLACRLAPFFVGLNAIGSIVVMQNVDPLEQWLYRTDPYSLGLRAHSLVVAKTSFFSNPLFGIGYTTDATLYLAAFKVQFYPEDLGGIGLLTSFGYVGFLAVMIYALISVLELPDLLRGEGLKAAGLVGIYIVIYSFSWPTFIYGDGTIMSSFLIASLLSRQFGEIRDKLSFSRVADYPEDRPLQNDRIVRW